MTHRICLATDSLDPSGVGEHMLVLAGEMRRAHDIVLACPASEGGRSLLERSARIGIGIKLLTDTANTLSWLRGCAFDLLHLHAGIGWEGHELAAHGRAAAIPRIVRTEHLPDLITDPDQRRTHREGMAHVDLLICVSAAAASTFGHLPPHRPNIAVVRNGLSHRVASRDRAAVRRDIGLLDGQPTVVCIARFSAQKDHATLISALPAVLERHPDACFLLVGTGPLEPEARRQADALGAAGAIRFLGQRADVPDLLAAADVFVLPSRFEGLPLAVLEAMDAGLPVVATQVGGTEEVVVDGETGYLVPPGDPERLATAVGALLDDPAQARAFGDAGRRRFEQGFTASRMAAETLKLYGGLGVAAGTATKRDRMNVSASGRTRVGFVGAGGIAQRHLGILEQFADVELAAFADPVEDRAIAAAARFGARSYRDLETMIEAEPLDALFICVPPFAHGAPERAALARKLPFFVEKPLSLDLAVAEDVGRAVASAGLITGVGYHWRYLDTVEEARGHLAHNPARFVSGYWLDQTPPPQWWWKANQSGGQINEQATHIIDLARYLVGDVTQVFGLESHLARPDFPGLDVATASTASLRFASGAIGNLGSTCLLRWNHRVGLHLFGDGLAIEVTDHDITVDVGRGRPVRHAEGDPVWRQDRDFIDAVRGGPNHIRCPYGEALATHRVALAIGHSAATGRPVDIVSTPAERAHV